MGRTTLKQIEELRQRWKFNEALGELAGYLKRRPKSKRALELMVDILHDLNDDSAAYEIVDILTELYPNNAGYWGAKTWYAREKGGADLLIKTVNDFIPIAEEGKKISPEKIYNNYFSISIELLIKQNMFQEANHILNYVYKTYKKDTKLCKTLFFDLADVHLHSGNYNKALKGFHAFLVDPEITGKTDKIRAINRITQIYVAQENYQKAQDLLIPAINKFDWWEFYGQIAYVYLLSNERDKALENLFLAAEKESEGSYENLRDLLQLTTHFVDKNYINEVIEFLQFLYEQNPSSGVVLERLVDAYALFYPALEKKIREKGRGFCNELINISTKYEEQEMWLKSVANNAIGVIEMESTNRGRAWKLFIETFKRYPENLDPFENLVSYSKNKKEYLEIIGLLNEYLEGTDIKLDENEIFINIIITFLEKVKNISLQQRIINIKLRYENTLLKNQNAWLESSSIYHGTMKDMVHDSFNTFRIKALGGEK